MWAGLTFQRVDEWWGIIVQWEERPTGRELWRTPDRPGPPDRPSQGLLETRAAPARTTRSVLTTSWKIAHRKNEKCQGRIQTCIWTLVARTIGNRFFPTRPRCSHKEKNTRQLPSFRLQPEVFLLIKCWAEYFRCCVKGVALNESSFKKEKKSIEGTWVLTHPYAQSSRDAPHTLRPRRPLPDVH